MTNYLKKAVLTNSGVWTTTITWRSSQSGGTVIELKQRYHLNRKKSYTKKEIFSCEEFDKSYERFHQLIKEWL